MIKKVEITHAILKMITKIKPGFFKELAYYKRNCKFNFKALR